MIFVVPAVESIANRFKKSRTHLEGLTGKLLGLLASLRGSRCSSGRRL